MILDIMSFDHIKFSPYIPLYPIYPIIMTSVLVGRNSFQQFPLTINVRFRCNVFY